MDVSPALQQLIRPGLVAIESDHALVERVELAAKSLGVERPRYGPSKPLKPVAGIHGSMVPITPLEILHEVGRATVFQERAAIRDIQRMWAQLRYCDAFSYGKVKFGQGHHLLHMSEDALAKRFHHANVQSESLGIGFAIILARHILTRDFPGWTWIPVDAEMVLDAGFDIPEGRIRPRAALGRNCVPTTSCSDTRPTACCQRLAWSSWNAKVLTTVRTSSSSSARLRTSSSPSRSAAGHRRG